jgi:hypothetical protein
MRTGATLLLALMSCALVASARADFRIAYSCDGNQHDADDWHASAMVLAMLAETGMTNRLVHFDYNNHLGDTAHIQDQPARRALHGFTLQSGDHRPGLLLVRSPAVAAAAAGP